MLFHSILYLIVLELLFVILNVCVVTKPGFNPDKLNVLFWL